MKRLYNETAYMQQRMRTAHSIQVAAGQNGTPKTCLRRPPEKGDLC